MIGLVYGCSASKYICGKWIRGGVSHGSRGRWIYHNHTIVRHILEHLIKDLVDHLIVSLGNHETDGGGIQIRQKFSRAK
jgi:hypothetical protein